MTDITLDDLVDDDRGGSRTDEAPEAVPAENDDSAEWLYKTVEYLDAKGYLDALLAESLDAPIDTGGAAPQPTTEPTDQLPAEPDDEPMTDEQIDSTTVASALKRVYDLKGNIELKELIQMVEENPDMVDSLLEREL